ncbi:hypothetical protein K7X08_012789 [Anisodus acutangulus]|uniref:At1g61320/AtMIF1 LRR domain-containing protein n=1 Tax=Anisodus acutangulus TaxID=402998 RepID=A0A9Q1MET2_9SOLA|nr:hypothetical protein K7X08_012789 [Anisodus acutangulus]
MVPSPVQQQGASIVIVDCYNKNVNSEESKMMVYSTPCSFTEAAFKYLSQRTLLQRKLKRRNCEKLRQLWISLSGLCYRSEFLELPANLLKTSILSKDWRYKWATRQELDFDAIFKNLISKCPLLERLRLNWCTNFDILEIDAANLKCLDFFGTSKSICFQNAPMLRNVTVWLDSQVLTNSSPICSNLTKFFHYMPSLQEMDLSGSTLEYLTMGGIPESPPTALNNVKSLRILDMSFRNVKEVSGAVYLITSCPKLQNLAIECETVGIVVEPVIQFLQAQSIISYGAVKLLQNVQMCYFTGFEMEMEFVKFILASAPVLEEIFIWNVVHHFHRGVVKSICFKNTLKIEQVTVDFSSRVLADEFPVCSNLVKFFHHMPNLQQLNLDDWVLQYLTVGGLSECPPTALNNVTYLRISHLSFENIEEVLYLITRCPKLQDFTIEASIRNVEEPVLQFMKSQTNSYGGMKVLRKACMFMIYGGLEPQMEFLSFLLSSAPALEEMYILNHAYPVDQVEMKKFPSASHNVKFKYEELGTDIVMEVP